jgi:alpha-galactosidase
MSLIKNIKLGKDQSTCWQQSDGQFWLHNLCGQLIGRMGSDTGPTRTQGIAVIQIDGRRYEGGSLVFDKLIELDNSIICHWKIGDTAACLTVTWHLCPNTGVVSRRDTLTNAGASEIVLSQCLSRVSLPSGKYEYYAQSSRWCNENQGAWQPLHTGINLRHAWGRTTEESTPYLALRKYGANSGLAFHVLPCGNWTIKVSTVTEGGELPYVVVDLGLSDENLHRVLQSGEMIELPEILFHSLPNGEPYSGTPALHKYLLAHHFNDAKSNAPVVYNTWFDQFDILDVPRLRNHLSVAKEIGCEVFVIDAGWYGAGGPNWWAQAGDWREKTEAAFCGKMNDFADEVRAAGLGFGLWMEPERFGAEAPIRVEHPEWFIPVGGAARIDLTLPDAYAYLRGEIGLLVEKYKLAWMKIDFNFILDADDSGAELQNYTAAWYRMLDEIRIAYPDTFFEGCSSGAMRGDLAMLTHVDGHFLSDTVNPVDMLRISQGAWLRLPPGRLTRWTVVRSAGQVLPRYGNSIADSPAAVLTPCGALWEPAETVDLKFSLLTAMPGMMGFSGDLTSLPPVQRGQIAESILFYKKWRSFITGAIAYLLTPPEAMNNRSGWLGCQLQSPDKDTSLVFVYRLGSAGSPPLLKLRNLTPNAKYIVNTGLNNSVSPVEYTGDELMRDGLKLDNTGLFTSPHNQAEIFCIYQCGE